MGFIVRALNNSTKMLFGSKTAQRLLVKKYNAVNPCKACSANLCTSSEPTKSYLLEEGLSLTVNNIKLNYYKHGNGKHKVLCLPGAIGSWRTDFHAQLFGKYALDPEKYTVIAWDPPGYGRSRPPSRDYSPDFFEKDADLAYRLMFGLNMYPYSVLGWSDGGITALHMAYQQRNTNLIKKLVIFGGNAYVTETDMEFYQKIRDVNSWSEKMKAPMIEMYGEETFKKLWEGWIQAFIRIYSEKGGDICKDYLEEIKFETLILHGKQDPVVGVEHPEFLVSNLPYARRNIEFHEEGKHNFHLRYPEWFKEKVEKFLDEKPFNIPISKL